MENVPSTHNVGIDLFAHVCHRSYWVGVYRIIKEMWETTDVIRIAMRTPTDQLPTACNVKKLNNFEEKSTNVMKIRIPLTVDIAFHIVSTSHGNFAPIQDSTRVDIQDISQNKIQQEYQQAMEKNCIE